jgi:hypothetical protein
MITSPIVSISCEAGVDNNENYRVVINLKAVF